MNLILTLLFPFLVFSSETYFIKPKAFLDVESGKMIESRYIGIKDDRITSITQSVPKKSKVIVYDHYLLPGLIDCHTHIFFAQYILDKDFEKALVREVLTTDDSRTKRARHFMEEYLDSGFTSVCDLGNSGQFLDVKLRDQIKSNPDFPDLFVSGPGISTVKGQFDPGADMSQVSKEYTIVDNKTDIEALLQIYVNGKVDILKIYVDNSPGKGMMDPKVILKILNSKKIMYFKKVTFHALEEAAFNELAGLGRELSFEHGNSLGWSKLKNKKHTYLTLTDLPESILREFDYYNKVFHIAQVLRAKEAYSSGVKLVFGSDFYFHKDHKSFNRADYVLKSIDAWKEASIPNISIIQAMTLNAARSLKLEESFGVIRPGAKANMIGVIGNPLTEIDSLKKVDLVINKGILRDKLRKKL